MYILKLFRGTSILNQIIQLDDPTYKIIACREIESPCWIPSVSTKQSIILDLIQIQDTGIWHFMSLVLTFMLLTVEVNFNYCTSLSVKLFYKKLIWQNSITMLLRKNLYFLGKSSGVTMGLARYIHSLILILTKESPFNLSQHTLKDPKWHTESPKRHTERQKRHMSM